MTPMIRFTMRVGSGADALDLGARNRLFIFREAAGWRIL